MKPSILAAALLAALLSTPALAHETQQHEHADAHAGQAYDPATAVQTPVGLAGDPRQVTRVIKLNMADSMRFTPAVLTIRQGETVRLALTNGGKMLHEIVLGTPDELRQHAAMMRQHPAMAHSAPNMLHVAPGSSGEIVWRFNRAGAFAFACLIPGHFEAGMQGVVKVTPSAAKAGR